MGQNSMKTPIEIERKYLIDRPCEQTLRSLAGAHYRDIVQTYLASEKGSARRVRKSVYDDGRVAYVETVKRRQSDLSAEEYERTLDEEEYARLLREADQTRTPIEKRRYMIPFGTHLLEIDLYPFWGRTAILEIELASEEEEVTLPDFLTVLREVSAEKAFKNRALALHIPSEDDVRN
jgi:CYTH domain-containing protein